MIFTLNLQFLIQHQQVGLFFDQISEKIVQKAIKIKGPRIDAPENAFKGFLKSNNLDESDVTQESTDKGKFYFANIKQEIFKQYLTIFCMADFRMKLYTIIFFFSSAIIANFVTITRCYFFKNPLVSYKQYLGDSSKLIWFFY